MSEAQKTSELPEALRVARAWTVEQRPEDIADVFLVSRALLDLYEQLEIEREKVEDFRMKVLKLATWYGHDTEAALGESSPASSPENAA